VVYLLFQLLLYLGCVDASASTAHYNLKKNRSLFIYIGGEKEQLLTVPNEHKIVLSSRKGFVKLALKYGAHLVPMVKLTMILAQSEKFTAPTYSY
jgi:Diacylglycerol acyltransferase